MVIERVRPCFVQLCLRHKQLHSSLTALHHQEIHSAICTPATSASAWPCSLFQLGCHESCVDSTKGHLHAVCALSVDGSLLLVMALVSLITGVTHYWEGCSIASFEKGELGEAMPGTELPQHIRERVVCAYTPASSAAATPQMQVPLSASARMPPPPPPPSTQQASLPGTHHASSRMHSSAE